MWAKDIEEEVIALERVLAQSCYWWSLSDAWLTIYIQKKRMDIKLPLPRIGVRIYYGSHKKYEEDKETEIKRVKEIWRAFTEIIKEKLEQINAGESTVEEEFKENIYFEDGKYGLKVTGSWI